MVFRNMNMQNLLDYIENKTLICFGAGQQLLSACVGYSDISFFECIDLIADNDTTKTVFFYNNQKKAVNTIDECLKLASKEPVILITVHDCVDVIDQLECITKLQHSTCFILTFVDSFIDPYKLPKNRAIKEHQIIPKIIHYCWFGGNPIPDSFVKCIDSWKKYCPDYEIVRWDESNYDYKKNEYMYEAYQQKKWGFVPDYARLDIVHEHGGVYMDTDVELIRNIDDLLCDEAFCGFESRNHVNNGSGFGAKAGFLLLQEQIMAYEKANFINSDGSINLKTGPQYQTEHFLKKGLLLNNTLQLVDGMTVYPSDVLSPLSVGTGLLTLSENSYSIHNYAGTWLDTMQYQKKERLLKRFKDIQALFK